AVLSGAVLRDAVLSDADLRGAVLSGADLRDADLRGAVLSGAVLSGAVLNGADLRGAVLSGAVLSDAVLSGAVLSDADGKQLPRATPEQAIENLDKVREIVLDNEDRLDMDHWHGDNEWRNRTCAEETLCGTTHCMAGWLQVCTTEPALKKVSAQLAGALAAPIASKMFYRGNVEALEWLRDRKYVAETEAYEKRGDELKARREGAQSPAV
ncbi:MAG: pentapeptide repeat-containing protein, partial [Polaromonas sp.]|uniref:pentapeptide repeat-containing protein n=1 Tax=Polaromonas sp. TaxID=1869339 RepID=UPI0026009205